MTDFMLVSSSRISAIPIRDCGEPLVDLYHCSSLRVSSKRNTSNPFHRLVRSGVAKRLIAAQNQLPHGFYLCLEEGFRSLATQRRMFHDYYSSLKHAHPHLSQDELMSQASLYVAVPDGVPPHSTGGAVDVTLVSENGAEYNFGSCSDDKPSENGTRNFTRAKQIDPTARRNRVLLIDAMESSGFANYPAEWWHWSFGDQYWAYCRSRQYALYGALEIDKVVVAQPACWQAHD